MLGPGWCRRDTGRQDRSWGPSWRKEGHGAGQDLDKEPGPTLVEGGTRGGRTRAGAHLGVRGRAAAAAGELGQGSEDAEGEADAQGEEEPPQRRWLQRSPAVPAVAQAAALPPFVPQVVQVTRLTQLEHGDGQGLGPGGCWAEGEGKEEDGRALSRGLIKHR